MQFDFKEKVLPHAIALAVLFIIISVFFAPVFSGKSLPQSDVIQHKGAAKSIIDHREKYGEEPLWTNSVFGGMPAYMVSTLHTGQLFVTSIDYIKKMMPRHINVLFIGAICFYILMITLGCSPIVAAISSIGFTFSTFTLVSMEAGHNTKIETLAYTPLVIAGIYLIFNKQFIKGILVGGIGTSMLLSANHYQIMYYALLGIAIASLYFVVQVIKEKDFVSLGKMIGAFALIVLLAVGNNFSKLFTSLDYIQKHSTRGKKELVDAKEGSKKDAAMDYDYAFAWSYGVLESATLLIPSYYGGSSGENVGKKSNTYEVLKQNNVPAAQIKNFTSSLPTYWGDQPFTSGPAYFGAVVFLLFFVSLFTWHHSVKWYLLGATIFTWMLSLGDNIPFINFFLFDHFPGMNKFRAVSMANSLTHIFVLITDILGLKNLLKENATIDKKALYKGVSVALGSVVLLLLIGISQDFSGAVDAQLQGQPGWLMDAIRDDRRSMLTGDAFRTLVFMVLGAVFLVARMMNKVTSQTAALAIGALVLVDLWGVSKRYIYSDKFEKVRYDQPFTPSEADQAILQDKDNYRVFNVASNTFNENATSYFHQSVGGYSPTKMQRYQDLVERQISKNNMNVVNMLNTRYIIRGTQAKDVMRNPGALGNGWFVKSLKLVNTANEEMDALKEFSPKDEAIINQSQFPATTTSYEGIGNIVLTEWRNNYLKYDVEASANAFAVFSEVYYGDDWKVTIDGTPASHVRVDYILRGMEVPAGKHTIEFSFRPENYYTNNQIASISSILSFLVMGGCLFLLIRSKSQTNA